MSDTHEIIRLITGRTGSGKSYRAVRRIIDDWRVEAPGRALLFTNLPLRLKAIERDFPDLAGRIIRIPREVERAWQNGEAPWEYFERAGLGKKEHRGSLLMIDEVHRYCGRGVPLKMRQSWLTFVGEVRHCHARAELYTQTISKMHPPVVDECGSISKLYSLDGVRLPVVGFEIASVLQVLGCWRGKYWSATIEREFHDDNGKMKVVGATFWSRTASYFSYYNSFSAPSWSADEDEEEKEEVDPEAPSDPWAVYTRVGIVWWFLRRELGTLLVLLALTCVGFWFCFTGGFGKALGGVYKPFRAVTARTMANSSSLRPRPSASRSGVVRRASVLPPGVPLPVASAAAPVASAAVSGAVAGPSVSVAPGAAPVAPVASTVVPGPYVRVGRMVIDTGAGEALIESGSDDECKVDCPDGTVIGIGRLRRSP